MKLLFQLLFYTVWFAICFGAFAAPFSRKRMEAPGSSILDLPSDLKELRKLRAAVNHNLEWSRDQLASLIKSGGDSALTPAERNYQETIRLVHKEAKEWMELIVQKISGLTSAGSKSAKAAVTAEPAESVESSESAA
ncbi:hypothetical protein V8E36_005375 [Tilletia maclaganii]